MGQQKIDPKLEQDIENALRTILPTGYSAICIISNGSAVTAITNIEPRGCQILLQHTLQKYFSHIVDN